MQLLSRSDGHVARMYRQSRAPGHSGVMGTSLGCIVARRLDVPLIGYSGSLGFDGHVARMCRRSGAQGHSDVSSVGCFGSLGCDGHVAWALQAVLTGSPLGAKTAGVRADVLVPSGRGCCHADPHHPGALCGAPRPQRVSPHGPTVRTPRELPLPSQIHPSLCKHAPPLAKASLPLRSHPPPCDFAPRLARLPLSSRIRPRLANPSLFPSPMHPSPPPGYQTRGDTHGTGIPGILHIESHVDAEAVF
eukprot:1196262-Prorocentrum_minimum.AAC.2